MQMRIFIGWCVCESVRACVCVRCMHVNGLVFCVLTDNLYKKKRGCFYSLYTHHEELLYCIYSKLKMRHHDSFAQKLFTPLLGLLVGM